MEIIDSLKTDEVYTRVLNKFSKDGPFTFGKKNDTAIYSYEKGENIAMDEMALGKYIYAINYSIKELSEVPSILRTAEFYISTFFCSYDYIKNNIKDFNREFFKDLIMTNSKSLSFEKNCFEIMPLEYIDEEMVSLAILNSTDRSSTNWLLSVYKRKPEAINEDVWKLAARLYGGPNFIKLLNITPENYKDREWYLELFKCKYTFGCSNNYSRETSLIDYNTVLMDYIPKEVLTPDFLIELIKDDPKNIARFSNDALETVINMENNIKKKIWQIAIEIDGKLIEFIELNEERIMYFKSLYKEDSEEYFIFKHHYREYLESKKLVRKNNIV